MATVVSCSLSKKLSGYFSRLKRQISSRFTTTYLSTATHSHIQSSLSSQVVTRTAAGRGKHANTLRRSSSPLSQPSPSSLILTNCNMMSKSVSRVMHSSSLSSLSNHYKSYIAVTSHYYNRKYCTNVFGAVTSYVFGKASLPYLQLKSGVHSSQTRAYAAQKIEHYKCKRGVSSLHFLVTMSCCMQCKKTFTISEVYLVLLTLCRNTVSVGRSILWHPVLVYRHTCVCTSTSICSGCKSWLCCITCNNINTIHVTIHFASHLA